jgi:hypothetical protein
LAVLSLMNGKTEWSRPDKLSVITTRSSSARTHGRQSRRRLMDRTSLNEFGDSLRSLLSLVVVSAGAATDFGFSPTNDPVGSTEPDG